METSEKEITEGNKLIAEFDGGEYDGHFWLFQSGECWQHQHELAYHESWDWLMPVVEKIQSIDITPPPNYTGYRIEIVVQGYVKISGFPMPTITKSVSIEGDLINAVWAAIVEFIQWYNKNKK